VRVFKESAARQRTEILRMMVTGGRIAGKLWSAGRRPGCVQQGVSVGTRVTLRASSLGHHLRTAVLV